MGTIERLTAGIAWNGYQHSLDVYFKYRPRADYEMKKLKESEDK